MMNRAARIAIDLIEAGFHRYRENDSKGNSHYYPILDTPPEHPGDGSKGWAALNKAILELCPPRMRYMNASYANCPGMKNWGNIVRGIGLCIRNGRTSSRRDSIHSWIMCWKWTGHDAQALSDPRST
ncbi:hypothetical protein BDZ45DRAFT_350905 [Acephala macrosclerotiorum]|nr:hypothetical protein BDZ45DRAFT_350905 [Acephala macrosclerotiorum]